LVYFVRLWLDLYCCVLLQSELIYVNYGRVEDYRHLDTLNINVSGKIVLARYGKIFRGDKVRTLYICFIYNMYVSVYD